MVNWSEMKEQQKEKKRELILKSAERIFIRHGYKKTSVDEIAKESKVSKGAIYIFFRSKEEIFKTLVERKINKLWEEIEKAASEKSDPREKIKAAFLAKVGYLKKLLTFKGVSESLFKEVRPIIDREIKKLEQKEVELLTQILAEGQNKNIFVKFPDVKLIAYALVRAMDELEIPWIFAKRKVDTNKKVDILLNLLFKGIEARPI